MGKRNVVTASKKLPEESRQAFIDAFKATNCMDLYDGDLTQYLQVIGQNIRRYHAKVKERDDALNEIHKLVKKQKASLT